MERRQKQALPIDGLLPNLLERLKEQMNAVLIAAPGAGKTTQVPLSLLDASWLKGQKIIMLEPRRMAASAAARYMAASLGEQPGGTVGYRVRMDTKVGPSTRIEVITEGVLTRMLQSDPLLKGSGLSFSMSSMSGICTPISAWRCACRRRPCSGMRCGCS